MSDPLEGRRLKIPSTGQIITVRHVVAPEAETGWTDVEREHYGRILHEQLVTAGAPLVVWAGRQPGMAHRVRARGRGALSARAGRAVTGYDTRDPEQVQHAIDYVQQWLPLADRGLATVDAIEALIVVAQGAVTNAHRAAAAELAREVES